jgi:hypothetical protein
MMRVVVHAGRPLWQPRALSNDELSRIFTINDPRHHSASDINFFYEVRTLMLGSTQYPGYQRGATRTQGVLVR